MRDIKVIEEWILVKPDNSAEGEKVTEAGLVLPAMKKEEVKRAKVLQISEDVHVIIKKDRDDARARLSYKVGDTVLFYGKTGIPFEDGEYMFLKYDGMLAVEVENETF